MGAHIDSLDASLQENGEDIVLQRVIGGVTKSVTVRAHVRTFRLNSADLVAGIKMIPFVVNITLTQIRSEGWPQGAPAAADAPYNVDPAIPVIGDVAIIKGQSRTIISVDPMSVGDEGVVRVKMMIEG